MQSVCETQHTTAPQQPVSLHPDTAVARYRSLSAENRRRSASLASHPPPGSWQSYTESQFLGSFSWGICIMGRHRGHWRSAVWTRQYYESASVNVKRKRWGKVERTLANTGKLTPFSLQNVCISLLVPGSFALNWFVGNAKISSPRSCRLSYISRNPRKLFLAYEHLLAMLTKYYQQ